MVVVGWSPPFHPFHVTGACLKKSCVLLFCSHFKGSVSRDFRPPISSHDWNPSGPLINRVKYFEFGFNLAEIFEFLKSSVVCIIPTSQ